ncbi:MAG: hypothetical protein JXR76_23850 [Deltaproteobacteria bacterium]|nr:hypothetical protein [Deltaproteobacteria bacterium]
MIVIAHPDSDCLNARNFPVFFHDSYPPICMTRHAACRLKRARALHFDTQGSFDGG